MSTFILTCVPSCCSLRELSLAMSRCEVLGRIWPWRVGWRSLAVVFFLREFGTFSISAFLIFILKRHLDCRANQESHKIKIRKQRRKPHKPRHTHYTGHSSSQAHSHTHTSKRERAVSSHVSPWALFVQSVSVALTAQLLWTRARSSKRARHACSMAVGMAPR